MPKRAENNEPATEATFEEAMERLEQLVEKMEADKLPLEELLVRYEEGVKLVKFCSERLAVAEKRIEIITKGADGAASAEPFEPGPAANVQKSAGESTDVSLF